MAINLASIKTETAVKAPRIIVLGVEKIGKTTFACGSRIDKGAVVETGLNNPVLLPIKGEEGADDLPVPKFPILNSLEEVMQGLASLYTEEHDYGTVVLDSASAFEPLIFDAVCKEANTNSIEKVGGGYGKGYTEALAKWRNVTEGLDALRAQKNMASIIIGHVKVKRFDDPGGDSYDQYQLDLHEKSANLLFRWADCILFCNTKVAVKKEDTGFGQEKARGVDIGGGQRFLYTQKRPAHPGGGRGIYGRLPYELPLDWAAYQAAIAAAIN
jgi:hypothetical protein